MVVIAGERSGVGKTTVTLALLSFLCSQGMVVQSFKVGPDYIDPMFHHHVTGRFCRNLDPVLTSVDYVQKCFADRTQQVDCALVEGVMGLFDGASSDFASTAHIALLLNLPVILVIDCSRLSGSVAAIAHGYRSLNPQLQIAGVVLNRVGSDRHLQLLQNALEPLNLPILGVLRRQDDLTIPDRHLGLVPTAEITKIDRIIDRLATIGETCFDWEKLSPLLKLSSTPVRAQSIAKASFGKKDSSQKCRPLPFAPRIAIARDRAFNFYYQDNLDILLQLGAELVYWSPLTEALPDNIQGLYFGGGFPEVFAAELADNRSTLKSVRQAITAKMPTIAECGGLMYLCQRIVDFEMTSHSMVGVIRAKAIMGKHLTLGYRQATALQDSPLVTSGSVVWGHEFHRSSLSVEPTEPLFQIRGYDALSPVAAEGWRSRSLHASYIHTHFGGNLDLPKRFIECCSKFI